MRPSKDGRWLKASRERLGLSQAAMAALLGWTQGNVAQYESGRNRQLPILVKREIERLLTLPPHDVVRQAADAVDAAS